MRVRMGKTGDGVGRPSWRSSFLVDLGAKFLCVRLGIGTSMSVPKILTHMKNLLNFVSTSLKVVDTRRIPIQLKRSSGIGPKPLDGKPTHYQAKSSTHELSSRCLMSCGTTSFSAQISHCSFPEPLCTAVPNAVNQPGRAALFSQSR